MPRLNPKIFHNKPWRKIFYHAIHKPSAEIPLSDEALDGVYLAFAETFNKTFVIAKQQLSTDRNHYALIPGRGKYYLSGFITMYMRQCQFMLLGQQDQHKTEIYSFYHGLIIKILKAFYKEIHHKHASEDSEFYDDFWNFIEESINESIALNYDSESLVRDTALGNLYSLYLKAMHQQQDFKQFSNRYFLELLNAEMQGQLRGITYTFDAIFSGSDKKTVNDISSMQMDRLKSEIIKLHDKQTESAVVAAASMRSLIGLVCGTVVGIIAFIVAPELIASYLMFYILALAAGLSLLFMHANLTAPRTFMPQLLADIFAKTLSHESTFEEICKVLDLKHSPDDIERLFMRLKAIQAKHHSHDEINYHIVGVCFLVTRELTKGAHSFRRQEIKIVSDPQPIVVYSNFQSANVYQIPDPYKLARVKSHVHDKQKARSTPKPIAIKPPEPKLHLTRQQKKGGALIQGANSTNSASAIYVRLPTPDTRYETELIDEMNTGKYTFASEKGNQGFKYVKDADVYRFKLFDTSKTRWNFKREGQIVVQQDDGTEKSIPKYGFYSRGKK